MYRSPIFLFLLLFILYSCKEKVKTTAQSKAEDTLSQNSLQARRLLDLGMANYANQKFDSAFYFYNRSKLLYEVENDSLKIAYNLLQMAIIQQIYGDYSGSEKNLVEALPYTQGNLLYQSAAYNQLGISSKELYNYDDALYYYEKAKSITKDTLPKISIENNIASVNIEKKEFNTSIKILEAVIKSKVLDTVNVTKARVLDNLGYSYFKVSRDQEGLRLMNKAMEVRKKNKDTYGILGSYLHLSEYFLNKDSKKANEYVLGAYQTTMAIGSVDERLESLSFLVKNNFDRGNNKYALAYIQLNDSIVKVRNNAKNQFAKIKYDSEQNRADNLKLSAQKAQTTLQLERQKNSTLLLYFVVLLVVFLSVFIINFLRTKSKREKIRISYNTETRISKKLHDELANDLYQTMTFAETQDLSTENNKETLLNDLDSIYSRTRNISRENSSIDIGPNFVPNLKAMMSNYSNDAVNILVNGLDVLQNTALETNKKITIYRTLQELLVNMKKHSQCSLVVITFKNIDKKIQIEYTDNGIGVSQEKINLKNGLLNVETRVKAIDGTLTFDNALQKGFKVNIIFPV
jgi:signal transduction histidine kinase